MQRRNILNCTRVCKLAKNEKIVRRQHAYIAKSLMRIWYFLLRNGSNRHCMAMEIELFAIKVTFTSDPPRVPNVSRTLRARKDHSQTHATSLIVTMSWLFIPMDRVFLATKSYLCCCNLSAAGRLACDSSAVDRLVDGLTGHLRSGIYARLDGALSAVPGHTRPIAGQPTPQLGYKFGIA